MTLLARWSAALIALALPCASIAQEYPQRPITIVHGFGAGGPPDLAARQIAGGLARRLGVPVIVENRTGASGTIAAAGVARSEPDGYTLLFGVAANLAVAPAAMRNPPYDARDAFTPIVEIARGPYVWLVREDAPASTMREFVDWAKRSPRKLNYASPGVGTVHHLATETLKQATGIDIVHVPYKTNLYAALLGGDVDAMFDSPPGPFPHIASGRLRALAVTGSTRLAALPDVPTLAEQGVTDPGVSSWWCIVGPRGLPSRIVDRVNAAVAETLVEPEVRAAFAQWGIVPSRGTPQALGAHIASEVAAWKGRVARFAVALE